MELFLELFWPDKGQTMWKINGIKWRKWIIVRMGNRNYP